MFRARQLRRACLAQFAENLRFAADALNSDGIRVLVEPMGAAGLQVRGSW